LASPGVARASSGRSRLLALRYMYSCVVGMVGPGACWALGRGRPRLSSSLLYGTR